MITFKQFLYESSLAQDPLEITSLQMDDALSELNEHASDANWMLSKNAPFFRGERSGIILDEINKTGFAVIDPSKTTRKSRSTGNYYTTILDNIPSRKDFPKRSRSLIASTDKNIAKVYASSAAAPLVLIPYNGVKIGVVNKPDIWNTKIPKFFNLTNVTIEDLNAVWKKIKDIDDSDWSSFLEFDKRLKAKDKAAIAELQAALAVTWDFGRFGVGKYPGDFSNFIENVDTAYSPEATGHEWYTTKDIPHSLGNTEVWIGGPTICMSEEMWEKLILNYAY